jgi:hypothetical protein
MRGRVCAGRQLTLLQRHAVGARAGGNEKAQHNVVAVDQTRVGHVDQELRRNSLQRFGDMAKNTCAGKRRMPRAPLTLRVSSACTPARVYACARVRVCACMCARAARARALAQRALSH